MKVRRVLLVEVVGGQVGAAAEPRLPSLLDEAPVGVHGGDARVPGMEDEAQAGGEEAAPLALELSRELLLQLAPDRRDVHPGLLEHGSALEHPGTPATTVRPLPDVLAESGAAVLGLHRRADDALEVLDVVGHPPAEVTFRLRSSHAHQCTGETRVAGVDDAVLGLELLEVVRHRRGQPLHVPGAGDDSRLHPRLGLLGLDVDEVQGELGVGVIHQGHVHIDPVGDRVVDVDLQRGLGQLWVSHGAPAYRPCRTGGQRRSGSDRRHARRGKDRDLRAARRPRRLPAHPRLHRNPLGRPPAGRSAVARGDRRSGAPASRARHHPGGDARGPCSRLAPRL